MNKNADFFQTRVLRAKRFCLDLEPSSKTDLIVISGGVEACAPDYDNRRESFPYCCIEFVSDGVGSLEMSGPRHHLAPGSVFAYGPGVPHRIVSSRESPMTKYFVDVAGRQASALLRLAHLPPGSSGCSKNPRDVEEIFSALVKHGCRDEKHGKAVCGALFRALVSVLADNVTEQGASVERALPTFQRIKDRIDEEYLALHSLRDMAKAARLDCAYLCRLFKRFQGETPYRYLTKLKMGHAASLLQGGGILVKEAAEAAGFGDPYQFSKAFKRIYGICPEKYAEYTAR